MFCIEAKDLSTHGLMFWSKITNEEQVFVLWAQAALDLL